MKQLSLIIFLLFFAVSCKEEYNLDLVGKEPKLVVDGLITNLKPPYLVRVSYSQPGRKDTVAYNLDYGGDTSYIEKFNSKYDVNTAEKNATVIISDNCGNVDTLSYIKDWTFFFDKNWKQDSVLLDNRYGYYQTHKIQGVAGHTYYLNITLPNGKKYTSQSYMPPVPKIDSAKYTLKNLKEDTYYVIPLLYFKNPENRRNFYMFTVFTWGNYSNREGDAWNFSLQTDEFLTSYVNGLGVKLTKYDSPRFDTYCDNMVKTTIYSLTEESYNYYKSVTQQVNSDGGAYSPAPATPKGNISDGALGLFRASGVFSITDSLDANAKVKRTIEK